MTGKVDVAALAKLARLNVAEAELARLEKEIPNILSFVETVQKVSADVPHEDPALRNVMRPDENPYDPGMFTEKLLDAAPARTDDRIAVKQVLSKKK